MLITYFMKIAEFTNSYKVNFAAISSGLTLSFMQTMEYINGLLPTITMWVSVSVGVSLTIVHIMTISKLLREQKKDTENKINPK